ncbi:MAG: hypothetical protein AB1486_04780, partial [Planctomycetota bacterium]
MKEPGKGAAASGDDTTRHLVHRWVAEGNPALGPLFERFLPDVLAEIKKVCNNHCPAHHEWEDLVQMVWQALCREGFARLDLEQKGGFRAQLLNFTKKRTIDLLRAQGALLRAPPAAVEHLET